MLGFPVKVPAMTCELGQELDHFAFIGHQVLIFREAFRVLRDDGTAWVNMGDSYAGSGKAEYQKEDERSEKQRTNAGSFLPGSKSNKYISPGLKPKDLIGIPWMLAYALRDDGWYLRSDIIWNKPNPMPESVTDRPTKAHEYIFLLSKSEKYYYDAEAIKTPPAEASISRWDQNIEDQSGSNRVPGKTNGAMKAVGGGQESIRKFRDKQRGHSRRHAGFNERWDSMTKEEQSAMGANKRSVWTVTTKPFKDAHFATYPQDLIVDMIKAGTPEGGVVLDMFFGSGTTGVVARKLYRNFIGIELNPGYAQMAGDRLQKEIGLFL